MIVDQQNVEHSSSSVTQFTGICLIYTPTDMHTLAHNWDNDNNRGDDDEVARLIAINGQFPAIGQ